MKKLVHSSTETYTTAFAAVTIWKNSYKETFHNYPDQFSFGIRYEFRNIQTNEIRLD